MRHATLSAFFLCFGAGLALAQDPPKPDPNKAYFDKLTAETAQGNTRSEVCLGELYATGAGMGLQQDLGKAFQLYQAAAAHGDLEGERHVGMAYMYGMGVQKDVEKAASIFRSLSEKGYAPADLDISLMYTNGAGAPRDDAQALSWLEKGAEAGDPDAEARLATHYHFGGYGLKQDDALAEQWLAKAASQKIDCMPTYGHLLPIIADAYLVSPHAAASKSGRLGVRFVYHDQRADKVQLMQSSGSKAIDDAWLNAVAAAKFPVWPAGFVTDDYIIGFWIDGDD